MSASVVCHGCGKKLQAPDGYRRRKLQCPDCGVFCELPASAVSPAPAAPPGSTRRLAPADPPAEAPAPPPERPRPTGPDEDDDEPVTVEPPAPLPDDGPPCPNCHNPVPEGAARCQFCNFPVRVGPKAARVRDKLAVSWESGWPFRRRRTWFLALQALFPLGLVGAWQEEVLGPFLVSWLVFEGLLLFLLGTYDRVDLKKNRRGQVRLAKTWRVGFVALPEKVIPLSEYQGVVVDLDRGADLWDWLVFFVLGCFGCVPAIVWYVVAIHKPSYLTALSVGHGSPELTLYKGWSRERAEEIAQALEEVAGLPYNRT